MALPGGIKGHSLDAALCSQGEADWNSRPPASPAWRQSTVQDCNLFHTLPTRSDETRQQKVMVAEEEAHRVVFCFLHFCCLENTLILKWRKVFLSLDVCYFTSLPLSNISFLGLGPFLPMWASLEYIGLIKIVLGELLKFGLLFTFSVFSLKILG